MKITVYYEDKNHPTILEVPDRECEIWVEDDYQRRLAEAEDKTAVERRTAQEIMDEDYNKPTFNNNQAETRRHVSLEALNADGNLIADLNAPDPAEADEFEELRMAMEKLKPKQKELVRKIFYEDMKQVDIAEAEGVSRSAVTQRLNTILARLKKTLLTEK